MGQDLMARREYAGMQFKEFLGNILGIQPIGRLPSFDAFRTGVRNRVFNQCEPEGRTNEGMAGMLLDRLQRIPRIAQMVNANLEMRERFVLATHLRALT